MVLLFIGLVAGMAEPAIGFAQSAPAQVVQPTDVPLAQPRPGPAGLPCPTRFALPNVKLKDHSLFSFEGWYYLVSIRIDLSTPSSQGEQEFAYARTRDFCTWEKLGTPLRHGAPGDADETYVWAPHVINVDNTFYMYYTGVNPKIAQTIMLATSTNPADPQSWHKQGVVFRPHHPDAFYPGPTAWSDCRDPMVLVYNNRYYLFYTGANNNGPIIGVAMAENPVGPWYDLGATYQATEPGRMPESPFIIEYNGLFYLFYNASGTTGNGTRLRWAVSPFGPWQPSVAFQLGWAHEFYRDQTGLLSSYIIGNGLAIGVERVRWQQSGMLALPQIGVQTYLPMINR
ncbi:MAG: family 43 glycosylhydrolase [Chloroflexales bacterium]